MKDAKNIYMPKETFDMFSRHIAEDLRSITSYFEDSMHSAYAMGVVAGRKEARQKARGKAKVKAVKKTSKRR